MKCGDNYTSPALLTHEIEIINEIMCGEALGKLECTLQILCMELLSPAPYLFIKIEHTREGKKKVKAERKKHVSTSYQPPVDYHHQRQRGVEATLL